MSKSKVVVVLLGAGKIGLSIVRRIASGKQVVIGDLNPQILESAKEELLNAGFEVVTKIVDGSDRASIQEFADFAASFGDISRYVHTAGVSPNQAKPDLILAVDLIGTAIALEIFRSYIAEGGSGIVVSSQAGHMIPFPAEVETALAQTPADDLAQLPVITQVPNSGYAYGLSKRANILRVQAEAVLWGDKGARINSISPGVIITPLARHELKSQPEAYGRMIEQSVAKRPGTTDEVARAAAFLLSNESAFITGTDLLIDGGVIASIKAGRYQLGQ